MSFVLPFNRVKTLVAMNNKTDVNGRKYLTYLKNYNKGQPRGKNMPIGIG